MTEILSQDEIDSLLTAISDGKTDPGDISKTEQKTIKIYDFRRPDKFTMDQIRALQVLHESFSRDMTIGLSGRLRALTAVHVVSVDQLTFEEFVRSVPNPATVAEIRMTPLSGPAVLEIDPAIAFTIIDRYFGGTGTPARISRVLTDIELLVMERILLPVLEMLGTSWGGIISLNPGLTCIGSDPASVQTVPPQEMVLLVSFEAKIGDAEGMINLCYPCRTINPVIEKLTPRYRFSENSSDSGSETAAMIKDRTRLQRIVSFDLFQEHLSPDGLKTLGAKKQFSLSKKPEGKYLYKTVSGGK